MNQAHNYCPVPPRFGLGSTSFAVQWHVHLVFGKQIITKRYFSYSLSALKRASKANFANFPSSAPQFSFDPINRQNMPNNQQTTAQRQDKPTSLERQEEPKRRRTKRKERQGSPKSVHAVRNPAENPGDPQQPSVSFHKEADPEKGPGEGTSSPPRYAGGRREGVQARSKHSTHSGHLLSNRLRSKLFLFANKMPTRIEQLYGMKILSSKFQYIEDRGGPGRASWRVFGTQLPFSLLYGFAPSFAMERTGAR